MAERKSAAAVYKLAKDIVELHISVFPISSL